MGTAASGQGEALYREEILVVEPHCIEHIKPEERHGTVFSADPGGDDRERAQHLQRGAVGAGVRPAAQAVELGAADRRAGTDPAGAVRRRALRQVPGGLRWRGLASFFVAVAVSVPFMAAPYYTGPIGADLHGVDVSYGVSFVIAAVLYFALARRAHAVPAAT